MKQPTPGLVIRHHQPHRKWLIGVLLIVTLSACGWGLFLYGRSRADFDFVSLESRLDLLQKKMSRLENENGELRQQKALLDRSGQIEKQAYEVLRTTLKSQQDEILELKEQLAFYRGIVSPNEKSKDIRIQRFSLRRNGQTHGFRYKLILIQALTRDKVTSGEVHLKVEGLQDEKPVTLSLEELTKDKQKSLSFRFKYFQNIEGDLYLPAGFQASRVLVGLDTGGRTISKSLDWPVDKKP